MTSLATRGLTAEEFLEFDDNGLELVDGEIQESCMGAESAYIATEIVARVREHVKANRLGLVIGDSAGLTLWPESPDRVRKPDGMYFANGHLPGNRVPKGWITVPPDLAIEVVSPHDRAVVLDEKVKQYLAGGVRLIWVIYPETRSAHVYRGRTVTPVFDGEDVLPGFRLPLGAFFDEIGVSREPDQAGS
jgi:Uma2 family endonuclease